jgi:pimeloyl-ACP methyl ester carboxylesterase
MFGCADNDSDSKFLDVDGMRVRYKRAGHGCAVVLLHGSASSLDGFDRVAQLLEVRFDVIRLDLPGFGMTGPRPDRNYRVCTYAKTVSRFMARLGVARYALAGNSLGGNIVWNLALDHPKRVTAAVLINATGYPEKSLPAGMRLARNPLIRPVLRRWMPRKAVQRSLSQAVDPHSTIVNDAMVNRVHRLWNRPGNRSAFVDFVNTHQPDRSAEVRRFSVPTLVLRSAGMDGQHFARDIAGSRELVHPHGGHLLNEEDPVWVADAIADFLDDGAGAGR